MTCKRSFTCFQSTLLLRLKTVKSGDSFALNSSKRSHRLLEEIFALSNVAQCSLQQGTYLQVSSQDQHDNADSGPVNNDQVAGSVAQGDQHGQQEPGQGANVGTEEQGQHVASVNISEVLPSSKIRETFRRRLQTVQRKVCCVEM